MLSSTPLLLLSPRLTYRIRYMHYGKAIVFKDKPIAIKIMATTNHTTMKQLGTEVGQSPGAIPYSNEIWSQHDQRIVTECNIFKFTSSEDLKAKLLATGDGILVETARESKHWKADRKWGIGLTKAKTLKAPVDQLSSNLLGKILIP